MEAKEMESKQIQTVYVNSRNPTKFALHLRRGIHTLYQCDVEQKSGYFFTPEELNKLKREVAEKVWAESRKITVENTSISYDEVRDMEFVEVDYSYIEKEKESFFKTNYPTI